MGTIFFIPLTFIALFESRFARNKPNAWLNNWFRGDDEGAEFDTAVCRNPTVDDPNCEGLQISKVPFEEIVKVFPNTQLVRLWSSHFLGYLADAFLVERGGYP
jgi:hypothetical protein